MSNETSPTKIFFKWALGLGVAVITLLAALFGVDIYIETKINTAIQDEKVIKKLQTFVRPSIIFDQNSTVLSDLGAWQFIGDLKVSLDKKGFVERIIITFKRPNASPILTSLDETVDYYINKVRGKKLDVIYELEVRHYSEPRPSSSLFNLEIVSGEALQFNPKSKDSKRVMFFPGRIVADGLDTIKRPGNTRINAAMGSDPAYAPDEGDTFYDTRKHCYVVYSEGKWKKLQFCNNN